MLEASKATSYEIDEYIGENTLALLPFGALEQHGAHLPLSTDASIANGLAMEVGRQINALILPGIPYGESWNNSGFPGTFSLSPSTIQSIVEDIGLELKRMGIAALIVINGHFGNILPIDKAILKLEAEDFPVLMLNHPGLEELANKYCDSAPAAQTFYHADEVETSLMLAIDPSNVQMQKAKEEYPEFPVDWGSREMLLSEFCKTGVFGDPRPSTKEKGKKILAGLVDASVEKINSFVQEKF